jgi:anti-sigma B factor antagonist
MPDRTKQFSIRGSAAGDTYIIALVGQIDAHTAPEFDRFLEQTIRTAGQSKLVLDFTEVEYISSAGLGVLMGYVEETRSKGGDIRLAALPERIYHILDLLGFPLVFKIYSMVNEAVSSYQETNNG